MAGMGPPPKDPKLRQRRNRPPVTQAVLRMPEVSTGHKPLKRPELPKRGDGETPWHPETLVFWREVWASPMAAEFIEADVTGLVLVARLMDKFNYGDMSVAAEIRLQRQCFGLTPLDRRRLQWEIGRAEESERKRPKPTPAHRTGGDPRGVLMAVK